jgi:hypothetical protein
VAAQEPEKTSEKIADISKEVAKVEDAPPVSETAEATQKLKVNGPVPDGFGSLFAQQAGAATDPHATKDINVLTMKAIGDGIVEITYQAPVKVAHSIQAQAADPESPLAKGVLQPYLVAKEGVTDVSVPPHGDSGVDTNVELPYGQLEAFGREDTARELTDNSIGESDKMVDQMERAEVAEEKRSVFRALTRLRGAAITSFDGVARSQTGNIDEYNKSHHWRSTHPLHHLANDEDNVHSWAFANK